MAIDSRNLDTDLTLEIDEEEITVAEFTSALDHFLGLVKEVARHVVPARRQEWLIKVFPGSAGIGLYAKPGSFTPSETNNIGQSVLEGIALLEEGKRHHAFSDKAIEHARGINKAFTRRERPGRVRVWKRNDTSRPITSEAASNAARFLDAVYEDDGSIEGKLEVLSSHGKLQLVIYDILSSKPIKCEISDRDLEVALQEFRNRVEVFGRVRYRRDGAPVSVRVDRIVPFPQPQDIPSLDEMRGILKG